jgi:hypothetical protein
MYTCEHKQPIARRCLECDVKHGFLPPEYVQELKLLRALEDQLNEDIDNHEPYEPDVPSGHTLNLLKALEMMRKREA